MEAGKILNFFFLIFAVLGGIDYFFDSKYGIGKEFERGIKCAGQLILCMVGFITLAPLLGDALLTLCGPFLEKIGSDPSLMAGILFAVDCGGAPAAEEMASSREMAILNGYFVASMFGNAVGGNLFLSLMAVNPKRRSFVLYGLAIGLAAIPAGCLVGSLLIGISPRDVFSDLLPLILLSVLLITAMALWTGVLLRILRIFGKCNVFLCIAGLLLAAAGELCGLELLPERTPFSEIMTLVGQIVLVLAGVFPLLSLALRFLERPLEKISERAGLSVTDTRGVVVCLVNCYPSIDRLPEMTDMGIVLNTAFGSVAGYALGDHFAYTSSAAPELVVPMIIAKVSAGVLAIGIAFLLRRFIIRK